MRLSGSLPYDIGAQCFENQTVYGHCSRLLDQALNYTWLMTKTTGVLVFLAAIVNECGFLENKIIAAPSMS